MSKNLQKKAQTKRSETVVIRVTPKVKEQWSEIVHRHVGKNKVYKTACGLLEKMIIPFRESRTVVERVEIKVG